MQLAEIITFVGVTYVGQFMGHHNETIALKNVFKIVPVPYVGEDKIMSYKPSLMPVFFFAKNDRVIEFNEKDILTFDTILDKTAIDEYVSATLTI